MINKDCYLCSIRLLTRRDYSQHELTKKLLKRDFQLADITQVLEKLKEMKYLDDQRYLEGRVRYYLKSKKGPDYILKKCQELRLEISYTLIEDITNELQINQDEHIQYHIQKKLESLRIKKKRYSSNEAYKIKSKVILYLVSKGYKVFNINTYLRDLDYELS